MELFNESLDYYGQDIHIVRNGEDFPLHLFFDSTSDLSYEFRLNDNFIDEDVSYEKITILVTHDSNNKIDTVNIKAEPYVSGNGVRVDNFFVTVYNNNNANDSATILLHLHNEIDQAWTSPATLSLRKGMALKFGVLASFTDGDYADLSFYPEMMRDLIYDTYLDIPPFPGPPHLPVYDPRRLSWKADPPENENPIANAKRSEICLVFGRHSRSNFNAKWKICDFGTRGLTVLTKL